MLFNPPPRATERQDNVASGSAGGEFGTVVPANATTPHAAGNYVSMIDPTAYVSSGIMILLGGVGTAASTNTRTLVDIAIGAAGSEVVIIPDLMAGQAQSASSASGSPNIYWFPIRIPAGARISARSRSLALSDQVFVQVRLMQNETPGKWYGQRVTAYGANEADSTGTSHTHGNGVYATTTQLSASTTNPIRAMQIGVDLLTDTTGSTARGFIRIAAGSSTNYAVSQLPYRESTTLESVDFAAANFLLSQMSFSIPEGSYLGVGADMNKTGEARGFIIYGVD